MSEKQADHIIELQLKGFDTVRDEILNSVLISISAVSLLPLLSSLWRIREIGWKFAMSFQILSFVIILIITIGHRNILYKYKAFVLVSLAFLIGCITTANIGLVSSGILFMVFAVILSTIFFGTRFGAIIAVCGLLFLYAITFGILHGWIGYSFNIESTALSLSSWVSKIGVFFCSQPF
jgi:hypothetical protein